MVTKERRIDRARRLAKRALAAIGYEFREARIGAGLTQAQVAGMVGISTSQMSRVELGEAANVPYVTLVAIATVLGLDLPLRTFPSGDPIRDAAQLALLAKLRILISPTLRWRTEVPLGVAGDLRAWDAVIEGRGWRVPVEAETRLRDVQACSRRIALKCRDDHAQVVVLLVAGTRTNRHALRLAAPSLADAFPVPGRIALARLAAGEPPSGSTIIVL